MARADHGHEAVYDASAPDWDAERRDRFPERFLIDRICDSLPVGAAVLDLGCGTGAPIAAHLLAQGLAVTAVDFSARMLDLARPRLPGAELVQADMRDLNLNRSFHAIIAWDSFFHLTAEEQIALIPRLAAHLKPQGWLLFTCGPAASEGWGRVAGGPVYHASLSPAGYAAEFERVGLIARGYAAEDPAVGGRTWFLARKETHR